MDRHGKPENKAYNNVYRPTSVGLYMQAYMQFILIAGRLWRGFPTSDVDESVPRDDAVFAVEVEVEQSTLPVTVIKLIADVPALRAKLLPLLRQKHTRHTKK